MATFSAATLHERLESAKRRICGRTNFRKYLQDQFDTLESYAIFGPPDAVPGGPDHDDYFIADQVRDLVADVRRTACRFGPDPGPCSDDTHAAMAYVGRLLEQTKPVGDLLTVTEVARRLQVNRDKVLGWIHYNRLKGRQHGQGQPWQATVAD